MEPKPETKLGHLYPPFLEKILYICQMYPDFKPTQGFRSFPEQAKLYFQGRLTPGPIVTQARPGESAHNFGLAVDFVHIREGSPDWSPLIYTELGKAAKTVGLVWGGDWHFQDRPHVQWPGYVTKGDLAPLKAIKQKQGEPIDTWLSRIWELLK